MPELKDSFSNANFDIAESIYQTFLDAGVIYSSPYPLAYAQMKINKLEDAIEDPMAPLKISPELTHELQFIFGN